MARLDAERRLREAEASLARLEGAVKQQGDPSRNTEEVKEEMIADVCTLKSEPFSLHLLFKYICIFFSRGRCYFSIFV